MLPFGSSYEIMQELLAGWVKDWRSGFRGTDFGGVTGCCAMERGGECCLRERSVLCRNEIHLWRYALERGTG